jgi:hypothetical protein
VQTFSTLESAIVARPPLRPKGQDGRVFGSLNPHEKASYHRGVTLLAAACERLGNFKALGWVQLRLLSDIYLMLNESLEAFADISPNDLSRQLRQQLHHQDY